MASSEKYAANYESSCTGDAWVETGNTSRNTTVSSLMMWLPLQAQLSHPWSPCLI